MVNKAADDIHAHQVRILVAETCAYCGGTIPGGSMAWASAKYDLYYCTEAHAWCGLPGSREG